MAAAGLFFGLAVLWLRVGWLQVVQHAYYAGRAEINQEQRVLVRPVRGEILDRHGRPLARDLMTCSVSAAPREMKDPAAVARGLAALLHLDARRLAAEFRAHPRFVWVRAHLPPGGGRGGRRPQVARRAPLGRDAARLHPGRRRLRDRRPHRPRQRRGGRARAAARRRAARPARLVHALPRRQPPDGRAAAGPAPRADRRRRRRAHDRRRPAGDRRAPPARAPWTRCTPCAASRCSSTRAPARSSRPSACRTCRPARRATGPSPTSTSPAPPSRWWWRAPRSRRSWRARGSTSPPGAAASRWRPTAASPTRHGADGFTFRDAVRYSSNIVMGKLGVLVGPQRLYRYATALGFGSLTGVDFPGETPAGCAAPRTGPAARARRSRSGTRWR